MTDSPVDFENVVTESAQQVEQSEGSVLERGIQAVQQMAENIFDRSDSE